jgi:two-component system, NarL family, sensor histidine kinase UhpB
VRPAIQSSSLMERPAHRLTLLWRVFGTNAAILALATLVLALSPITVSFPIALAELVALGGGLAAMLLLNLALLRRTFRPLSQLTSMMRGIDPLRPGERAGVDAADPEVAELAAAFNDMLGRLELERRESARRALAAQERERRRIARELHDEVGQALTAVVLLLDRAGRSDGPEREDGVAEAREAVRASLEEVRGIARRLRPEALDDLGLRSALAALTNDVTRRTGLRVERRIAPGLPPLDPEEELVVYRVAQEALTNIVRHAEVPHAELVLAVRDGRVELRVSDAGAGFEPDRAPDGTGLLGMRERALLIAAELEVRSVVAEGTSVRLRLAGRP